MLPHVYFMTWCTRLSQLYGSALTFKSLRVGFPTSAVHVVDSASIPEARAIFRQEASRVGASFMQLERRIELPLFINEAISRQSTGPAVFLDGDLCFWNAVEHWQFDALLAGRYLPKYNCEVTGCLTYPRLHPSLLWIPDVAQLKLAIAEIRKDFPHFHPFAPYMFSEKGIWHFFDNAASIFNALPHRMKAFTELELDAYDHLFSGTFADKVSARMKSAKSSDYLRFHELAQQDYRAIRGAWRIQQEYFESLAVE